jgi:cyclophilin family peptidyl-prolyl cis-trans isomerase
VRVNAVRSLQAFPFGKTKSILSRALHDEQVNVCIVAAEVIKQKATVAEGHEVLDWARYNNHPLVQANLYEAVLSLRDDKEMVDEIQGLYRLQTNPYHKAALITALQQSVSAYGFIASELFATETPVIRSSAAAALVAINQRKNFDRALTGVFSAFYKQAIVDGDPAVIGAVCTALADSSLGYKKIFPDFSFLIEAKNKLSLPKDFEALQSLEAALAYFENRKPKELKDKFNHPIDWTLAKTISEDQEAIIKTSKGNIVIRLLVEEAPGSVANFVALVKAKYYDHKIFHRVVPNFVVQAGCNRGDGWGSEDYSIRSEFSTRKFLTGSVGMASAGKDTEGTQWFITHSPTPHLDGRYTLFAEVIEGMNVVHLLEQGDEILEVTITQN